MMVRIYVSDVIDAPVEKVWGLIRDFNGMPKWHPFVRDSHIENGLPSDAIGSACNFHLHLREQLLTVSDRYRECVYCILDSPLPVTGYAAAIAFCGSPRATAPSSTGGPNSRSPPPTRPRWSIR
jgi:hypothetical protein